MRYRVFLCVVFFVVLLLIIGCNDNPTGPGALDQEAIENYILGDEDGFFSFDAHYGAEDTVSGEGSLRAIAGPSIWWRWPQDISRQILINIVNDSAFVTISLRAEGIFHILEIDTSATPDTIILHQKDLADNFISYAIFKRHPMGCSDCFHSRGWRLETISGAEINSDSVEVQIDSVRINCASYEDTVLTDPWVFFDRENLITLGTEEEVTLTLYSFDNVYAYLHAKSGGDYWRRWKFDEMESYPPIFQGGWRTSSVPGIKVAAFDVLDKNTLDDETYKYDSNVWVFPYRVE